MRQLLLVFALLLIPGASAGQNRSEDEYTRYELLAENAMRGCSYRTTPQSVAATTTAVIKTPRMDWSRASHFTGPR